LNVELAQGLHVALDALYCHSNSLIKGAALGDTARESRYGDGVAALLHRLQMDSIGVGLHTLHTVPRLPQKRQGCSMCRNELVSSDAMSEFKTLREMLLAKDPSLTEEQLAEGEERLIAYLKPCIRIAEGEDA